MLDISFKTLIPTCSYYNRLRCKKEKGSTTRGHKIIIHPLKLISVEYFGGKKIK